jgi:hypothetical protein
VGVVAGGGGDGADEFEFLRNKQTALIAGSDKLCAHGITQHGEATRRALTFIKAEARHIADQLDALGQADIAADARTGWAIILPPATPPEYAPLTNYPQCRTEECANNPASTEANCPTCCAAFFAAAHVFATFDAELGGPLPPGYEPSPQERHLITTLAANMGYTVEWSETPRSYSTARAWWNLATTGWPEDD